MPASSNPGKPGKKRQPLSPSQRRALILPLGLGMLLLLALVFSQQAFNLHVIPDSAPQTLLLVALSALVFLLFVALSFVLFRNLLKLYAERRLGVLGSRFRTRMVIGALLLSFAPALTMFLFSYALMNRSIDKWFSGPVYQLQQDAGRLVALLSDYAGANARREAIEIAREDGVRRALASRDRGSLLIALRDHELALQGGFAIALAQGHEVADWNAPLPWETLRGELPDMKQLLTAPQKAKVAGVDFLVALATAGPKGQILAGVPLPKDYAPALARWQQHQQTYQALGREAKRIRVLYVTLLLLLTVLVLFIATWLSLFVAKLVTRPVEALAEATREISAGHLGHRVEVSAADELGELVASFNRMAAELESNRKKIEESARALAESNTQREQRRRHIETILESIPTGVLSLDPDRRVTHSNMAFGRMFRPGMGAPAMGSGLRDVFALDVAADLEHLLRRAERMGVVAAQFEILGAQTKIDASVTVASVRHQQQRLGYVIVFEDFSDLLKAQQEVAWREVARRVAHEIKNPLTPIALSADRIRRHLDRGCSPDAASLAIIHSCADTISGAVQTVRSLVDEFATLARFPASQPRPSDLNTIVEDALAMFSGRLEGIRVQKQLDSGLPLALADPEAIKRAVANLIDNAAEATNRSLVKEIHIATALVDSKDALELTVADTGHGIGREVKEKLFLPYFSTKKRGTGLGLAIVRRIVEDHHGAIRVEENHPSGAKFIVELPLAEKMAAAETLHA